MNAQGLRDTAQKRLSEVFGLYYPTTLSGRSAIIAVAKALELGLVVKMDSSEEKPFINYAKPRKNSLKSSDGGTEP
jgi:hypothetical protein